MIKKRKIVVNKNDYSRILLTETLPDEVPLNFSNEGFYRHCKKTKSQISQIIKHIIIKNKIKYTVPYKYLIHKDSVSYRELALIHPSAQYEAVGFYKEYGELICHYCSKSNVSLRSPKKIGGAYYKKNNGKIINKYKNNSVNLAKDEDITRNSISYFSYKEFNRLYKFFDSEMYTDFEKRYSEMWFLDISKCFHNIYTHTISWAVKPKEFVKENIKIKSTFDSKFDALMQKMNYSETNGILIGAEIFRLFAEIILQSIDNLVVSNITNNESIDIIYRHDYEIKRYVDDIFIFAKDKTTAQMVFDEIIIQLSKNNLYINEKKIEKYSRPFHTKKSNAIFRASIEINKFLNSITVSNNQLIEPQIIIDINKAKNSFIKAIKSICFENNDDYNLIANYLISVLVRRIMVVINDYSEIEAASRNVRYEQNYNDFMILQLEIIYFFYSVQPTVNSSYDIGKAIILSIRFFEKEIKQYLNSIKQHIYDLSVNLLNHEFYISESHKQEFVPLEKLNLLLSISELGNDYDLPEEFIEKLFNNKKREPNYFEITACLFYIKNNIKYIKIKQSIIESIIKYLDSLEDITRKSNIVYLFLDTISCPYIEIKFRKKLLKKFYKDNQLQVPQNSIIEKQVKMFEDNEWFIKWKNIDLLNELEKKELRKAY